MKRSKIGHLVFYTAMVLTLLLSLSLTVRAGQDSGGKKTINAKVELSAVKTGGNTDNKTLSGKAEVTKDFLDAFHFFVKGATQYAESNGDETESKISVDIGVEREFNRRLFASIKAGYSRDKFSGYDSRTYIGPGIGYYFKRNDIEELRAEVSILYNRDDFSSGNDSVDNYLSIKTAGYYTRHINENLTFKQSLKHTVSTTNFSRNFIDSETKLETRLNSTISLALSYIINYQSNPPSSEVERIDTTAKTTLIARF